MDPYPDVELALLELLEPFGRTVTTLTDWTSEGALPAIRVQRIGGGDAEDIGDEPLVLLRCYAQHTPAKPRASQDVARQVRNYFKALNDGAAEGFAAGTLIDRAYKQSGPTTNPFDGDTAGDPEKPVKVTELIYRVTVRD